MRYVNKNKIIMGILINRRKRRLASDLFNPPILARDPCPVPSYSRLFHTCNFTIIEKVWILAMEFLSRKNKHKITPKKPKFSTGSKKLAPLWLRALRPVHVKIQYMYVILYGIYAKSHILCIVYYTMPLSPSLTEDIFESHDISIGHQFVISVNNWIFHFLRKNVRKKLCLGLRGLRTATKFCTQLPTFIQTQPSNCSCFVRSWTHQEQCMPILKFI